MKRIGGFALSISLVLVWMAVMPARTSAAACSTTGGFGAVQLRVPTLPGEGDYALWVRMQTPSTSGKVLVEANASACFEISSSELVANQWSWVAYRTGSGARPIKFASASNNILTLIGVEPGIKVDKVMLTRPDCVPIDFGNNCTNAVDLAANQDPSTILQPPSDLPVRGEIVLTTTPTKYQRQLVKITYSVDGRRVMTAEDDRPFDTTLLPNGKHTVTMLSELKGGQKIRETTVIEVDNPENAFTPVIRWLRVNQQSVLYTFGIAAAVLGSLGLLWWLRRALLRHRQRKFHGF